MTIAELMNVVEMFGRWVLMEKSKQVLQEIWTKFEVFYLLIFQLLNRKWPADVLTKLIYVLETPVDFLVQLRYISISLLLQLI